ncbi:MAG TPA: hypothetical protein P5572_11170 [Phycisphaerae bacterium]|nr:hypothetical protein [Phycisphaerae bacterium]
MFRLGSRVLLMLLGLWLVPVGLPYALAISTAPEVADASSIWQWIATVVLFILFVAVFFKNSKRSHQN